MSESVFYPSLFSPLEIGHAVLRNRVVLSAMTTGFGFHEGAPTEAFATHMERVGADVGLATVAFGAVRQEGRVENQVPWMWRSDIAEGLAPIATLLKRLGAVPSLQLGHGGRQVSPSVTGRDPVGPSPIAPNAHVKVPPHELSTAEVLNVVEAYASAAAKAEEAGFTAVELHGGHGYLIQQFLAADSNMRVDQFGGSDIRARTHFGRAIVEAIRAVSPNLTVMVRLNGDDIAPGGLTPADALVAAQEFEAAGAHGLIVSGGVYGSVPWTIPVLDDQEPTFIAAARYIKSNVGIPVISVGGFRSPAAAEAALLRGDCDAVAVGRSLLADPLWVEKARHGKAVSIRPCIATLQGCAGKLQDGNEISCQVNPEIGRNDNLGRTPSGLRSVVVIGGGPAGLEAARRAAELGYKVTIHERESQLGGQARLAALTPPLRHFAKLVSWYDRELNNLGVLAVTSSEIRSMKDLPEDTDAIIVATGSEPVLPMIEGYDLLPSWSADDFFRGAESSLGTTALPGRLVVLGSGTEAVAIALLLAERGNDAVVVSADRIAADNSGIVRRALRTRLERAGIPVVSGEVEAIEDAACIVIGDNGEHSRVSCDGVIVAERRGSVAPFADTTLIRRIGDARQVGDIAAAIEEGRAAADGLAERLI